MNWYKILGALAAIASIIGLFYTFSNEPEPKSSIQINDDVEITGGNFAGRDNIFYYSKEDNSQYIKLLRHRGDIINKELKQVYNYAPVQEFLPEFNDLHEQHIKAILDQNMILAHEILGRIHRISYELEKAEDSLTINAEIEKGFNIEYGPPGKLTPPNNVVEGHLMNQYVHGTFQNYSRQDYDSLPLPFQKALDQGYLQKRQQMLSSPYRIYLGLIEIKSSAIWGPL